jgi:hypothetical protein
VVAAINQRAMRGRLRLFGWILCSCLATAACPGQESEPLDFRTGRDFRDELEQPVTVTRSDVELRPLLARLSADRKIAIVLDRRIDPGRLIDASLPPMSLLSAIRQIAAQAEAGVSVVGDTIYVGPPASAGKLRTLCLLRELDLDDFGAALGPREFELSRTHTFAWDDLERPFDLLVHTAQRSDLTIDGIDQIPHDFWAGGTMVGVTATEAVSLVLIQFDLTFQWTRDAEGIRLVPVPRSVAVERTHSVRSVTPDVARDSVLERFPDLRIEINGRELTALATVEQHEVIEHLARGEDPDEQQDAGFGPIARRRFTLTVVRKPAGAVIRTLQVNGVNVTYDVEALSDAGIDLAAKISLDLKQATVDELFQALCEPLGLEYEIDGENVMLRPGE